MIDEFNTLIIDKCDCDYKPPTLDIDGYSIIFSFDLEKDVISVKKCQKAIKDFLFTNFGRAASVTYYNSVIFDGGNGMWSVKRPNSNLPSVSQRKEILLTRTPVSMACKVETAGKLIQKLREKGYFEIPTDDFKKSGRAFHKDFNKNPPPFYEFVTTLVDCCEGYLHIIDAGMRWRIEDTTSFAVSFFDSIEVARMTEGLRVGLFQVDMAVTTYSGPNKLPQWQRLNKLVPLDFGDVGRCQVTAMPVWNMRVDENRDYHDQVGGFSVDFESNSSNIYTKGMRQVKLYITSAHYVRNYNKYVPEYSGRWHNIVENQSIIATKRQTKLMQKIGYEVIQMARTEGFGHRFEVSYRFIGVHEEVAYFATLNDIIDQTKGVYQAAVGEWFDHVPDASLPTVDGIECKLKWVIGSMLRDLSFDNTVLVKSRLSPVQIQWLEAMQMHAMCGMGFSGGGIVRRMRKWLEGDGFPYDPDGLCYIIKNLPDCVDVNGNLDEEGRDAVVEFSESLIEQIRMRDDSKSKSVQRMWLNYHEQRMKALMTMEDYEKDIKNLRLIEEMGGTEEMMKSANDDLRKELQKIQDDGYCKMTKDESSLEDEDLVQALEETKHPLIDSDNEEENEIDNDVTMARIDKTKILDVTLSNTMNDERRIMTTMAQSREAYIEDQIIDHTCAKWWMQLSEKIHFEHTSPNGMFPGVELKDTVKQQLLNASKNDMCKHWYEGYRDIMAMVRELNVTIERKWGGRSKSSLAAVLERHYDYCPLEKEIKQD